MRYVLTGLVGTVLLALACSSSSSSSTPTGSSGACGDQGYLDAVDGGCPVGTCLQPGVSPACCGSQCATCEDKGYVSLDDAGGCSSDAGLCLSADVTIALTCCQACPGTVVDAAPEATPPEAAADVAAEVSVEASAD